MSSRLATLAAVCVLVSIGGTPPATAEPADQPSPDTGLVESGPPGVVTTPDGRTLTVLGKDETQVPVAPLTTATSSREYLVGGTFTGTTSGSGGGTLEAGYQIGCGIELSRVELSGSLAATPAIGLAGLSATVSVSGQINPNITSGKVTTVSVSKKKFKGNNPRVVIAGLRVKVDGCVGQSFVRSYATLTSSTPTSDDIVGYLGVTKSI